MRKSLARTFTLLVLACTGVVAWIVIRYLQSYSDRYLIAVIVGGLGLAVGIVGGILLARQKSTRRVVLILAFAVAALVVPAASMMMQRVTTSSFGFTVYGLIPVPVLDITVDANGVLWFRDKTHLITLQEVTPLIDGSVDVLIVGTGWHEVARVEDAVLKVVPDVRVLKTPKAFALYNRLVAEGKRVVLIAHSTC
ncbi:MAG: hypothetical protein CMJ83_19630 [Planctomycetes bacterium]|nr:hypothetical protein [Planctomycetota bacterium]